MPISVKSFIELSIVLFFIAGVLLVIAAIAYVISAALEDHDRFPPVR
jgi:hypothetical protein